MVEWSIFGEWLREYEMALRVTAWIIVSVSILQNLGYLVAVPSAWRELRQHAQEDDTQTIWDILTSRASLPISIIVPAYNEASTIVASVQSLLALEYPDFEVIVVSDGSTDDTMERLKDEFALHPAARVRETEALRHAPIRQIYGSSTYPDLTVVEKENGGKADAINAGLSCVHTPLFCVIDADSLLDPQALLIAVRPFMESDGNLIAAGGTVGIANGCTVRKGQLIEYGLPKRFVPRVQVVEYSRAFLMARLASSRAGTLTLISGAFGLFRRDVAMAVGGYDHRTVGEDMELVLKMHRHMKDRGEDYEIRYVPEPVCWTEAPETLAMLSKQRIRWQRGAIECIARHRQMIFNPRYGRLGMVTMPFLLLADFIGPITELLGYLLIPLLAAAGLLSPQFLFAYMALIFLFGIFLSMISVVLEQAELERMTKPADLVKLALTAVLENFGYRQLCNYWRCKAAIQSLTGKKGAWEPLERVGFQPAA